MRILIAQLWEDFKEKIECLRGNSVKKRVCNDFLEAMTICGCVLHQISPKSHHHQFQHYQYCY